ncbi:hypothetical protein PRUPE_6G111500 [Prunus persica]|uniref:Uncharacterized protein n=1 Tax=Prunus persica TaxID=3760 RepID=A0A251NNN0_PRUPE|nr:hypothetical protein PRUPE_6G111500 [Prunus persica]
MRGYPGSRVSTCVSFVISLTSFFGHTSINSLLAHNSFSSTIAGSSLRPLITALHLDFQISHTRKLSRVSMFLFSSFVQDLILSSSLNQISIVRKLWVPIRRQRGEPNHIARVQGHRKRTCSMDSSNCSHSTKTGNSQIFLLNKFSLVRTTFDC